MYLRDKRFRPGKPQEASWGERYFHMSDPDGTSCRSHVRYDGTALLQVENARVAILRAMRGEAFMFLTRNVTAEIFSIIVAIGQQFTAAALESSRRTA